MVKCSESAIQAYTSGKLHTKNYKARNLEENLINQFEKNLSIEHMRDKVSGNEDENSINSLEVYESFSIKSIVMRMKITL